MPQWRWLVALLITSVDKTREAEALLAQGQVGLVLVDHHDPKTCCFCCRFICRDAELAAKIEQVFEDKEVKLLTGQPIEGRSTFLWWKGRGVDAVTILAASSLQGHSIKVLPESGRAWKGAQQPKHKP